jgi:hypothetical protein
MSKEQGAQHKLRTTSINDLKIKIGIRQISTSALSLLLSGWRKPKKKKKVHR